MYYLKACMKANFVMGQFCFANFVIDLCKKAHQGWRFDETKTKMENSRLKDEDDDKHLTNNFFYSLRLKSTILHNYQLLSR